MAADFADEESVREDENDYDVIIIGAGLAGLTCAYNILRKETGLDVLVIEANTVRDLNNVSALWFFVMLNGASGFLNRLKIMIGDSNRYFVQDGMCTITHTLLKDILRQHGKIRYVEPVSKITFNDDRAYVSTTRNYFRCEFVVIAIPPSMQSSIIIEPSLSSINIETLYTPAENVFFNVFYKKPFWRSNSTKDIITTWDSSNNSNIIYDATLGNTEGIVFAGFLAEPNLEQTHKRGLFDTLEDCYETVEATRFLRYKEYDQSLINDEMKPGCPMSVLKPISIQDYINHTEASYERIFFASSEYAINWPGTIDGAIQAGEVAAYEILWRIRPQALSSREMSRVGYILYFMPLVQIINTLFFFN
ncbi:amine oxidase [flavin-containing] A-like [Bombus flavifrons]|uniref:amine oxidase [flavin-containing] A-like n=1 Tax=Bombus flavifrons TaxID=103934 RepID=UPI0037044805